MLHSGERSRELLDQLQALLRVAVERDDADVGLRLADDVGEELVPRALGLEPDHVHAQQHGLQGLARRVARIDDGQTKTLLMMQAVKGSADDVVTCGGNASTLAAQHDPGGQRPGRTQSYNAVCRLADYSSTLPIGYVITDRPDEAGVARCTHRRLTAAAHLAAWTGCNGGVRPRRCDRRLACRGAGVRRLRAVDAPRLGRRGLAWRRRPFARHGLPDRWRAVLVPGRLGGRWRGAALLAGACAALGRLTQRADARSARHRPELVGIRDRRSRAEPLRCLVPGGDRAARTPAGSGRWNDSPADSIACSACGPQPSLACTAAARALRGDP